MSGYKRFAMLGKGQEGWKHAKVTLPPSSAVTTVGAKRRGLDDDIAGLPWPNKSSHRDTDPDYTGTHAFEVTDGENNLVKNELDKPYWRRRKSGGTEEADHATYTTQAETAQTTQSA